MRPRSFFLPLFGCPSTYWLSHSCTLSVLLHRDQRGANPAFSPDEAELSAPASLTSRAPETTDEDVCPCSSVCVSHGCLMALTPAPLCMHAHTCMHTHTCACTLTHVCVHTHTCTHAHTVCTHSHMCMHTHIMCAYTHACTLSHVRACSHAFVHTHTRACTLTYVCTHVHACMHSEC